MTFALAHPWALLALPLPLLALLLPPAPARAGPLLRAPSLAALVAPGAGARARWPWLALLAWLLLVLAAARPQWLGPPVALPLAGRDLMLAVDLSGSMSEQDMVIGVRPVDRLTAVKAVAGDFIERRVGDRVGLILFGSRAYLQAPLTFDRATVRTLLFEAEIGLAGRETAIGDAIGLAVKHLRVRPQEQRVLILLTDGENNAGVISPERATALAVEAGVRIHTIAFGGEPRAGFGLGLPNRHPIDEQALKTIAEATGGRFFRARNLRELQAIYAALDAVEPVLAEARMLRPMTELFAWPLAGALLLTLLRAIAPWLARMASVARRLAPPLARGMRARLERLAARLPRSWQGQS